MLGLKVNTPHLAELQTSLDLFYFYAYACFSCTYVCISHTCLVPTDVRKRHHILWTGVRIGSSVRTSALNSCLQPYNLGLVNVTFHCLSLTWPVTWLTSCSYGRNQIYLWHNISSSVSRGSVICDSPEWKRCPPDYLPKQATVVGSPFHLAQTCQLLGYIWHQLLVEADFW